MSVESTSDPTDGGEICERCGMPIEEDGQDCPALGDGRCGMTDNCISWRDVHALERETDDDGDSKDWAILCREAVGSRFSIGC